MGRPRSSITPGLNRVLQRIERWRSTRRRHSPMPAELWSAAVSVARKDGVSLTSRVLGLSYGSLKERVTGSARQAGRREAARAGFVELPPGSLTGESTPSAVVLELCGPDGAKLVVRLRGSADLNLPELAEAFWRRRP